MSAVTGDLDLPVVLQFHPFPKKLESACDEMGWSLTGDG